MQQQTELENVCQILRFFQNHISRTKNKNHRLDINVRHSYSIFELPFTDSPIRSSVLTS
jgi:hypothetical protein